MHKQMLKDISDEKLREEFDDILGMIKETNHKLYDDIEVYLYKENYGKHFNHWMLEMALSEMINEDGTKGGHWSVEQTNSVAKQNGISFTHYNEYDWNYVMNMMYSDYYGVASNDTSFYAKLSIRFLEDKDAKEGKALCYYLAMRK